MRPGSENYISADLRDRDGLAKALEGLTFDYVVNCGGYIDHRPINAGGGSVIEAHFTGVLNLVAGLDRSILRTFVNIGSSDEYGAASAPQTEEQREAPISPYSLGKTASTHLLQMLHRTEGFPAITLRIFLTYGPGQDNRRFVPQIATGCIEGRAFPTSGGEQLRDFCYIEDVVDAIFATFDNRAAAGEVVNVGSGQPVAIREVVTMIRNMVGQGAPQFGAVPYRAGENMALYADTAKAKQLLGWSATTDLATGLHRTIGSLLAAK